MSKKKNTLKDLDEFLKQQAATIVTPENLSQQVNEIPSVKSNAVPVAKEQKTAATQSEISSTKILEDLKKLAEKNGASFRKEFYDIIIKTLETERDASSEDMMLINTALYLKHGDNWKDRIREYWKNK
jgi:inosine-uridine nucleoside N-ribohydrolase